MGKLLSISDILRDYLPISRSTFWRIRQLPDFPKHYDLGIGKPLWLETDVLEWIKSRYRG